MWHALTFSWATRCWKTFERAWIWLLEICTNPVINVDMMFIYFIFLVQAWPRNRRAPLRRRMWMIWSRKQRALTSRGSQHWRGHRVTDPQSTPLCPPLSGSLPFMYIHRLLGFVRLFMQRYSHLFMYLFPCLIYQKKKVNSWISFNTPIDARNVLICIVDFQLSKLVKKRCANEVLVSVTWKYYLWW